MGIPKMLFLLSPRLVQVLLGERRAYHGLGTEGCCAESGNRLPPVGRAKTRRVERGSNPLDCARRFCRWLV